MRKFLIILFMFSFFSKSVYGTSGDAYDYKFDSIDGGEIKLSDYKDNTLLINLTYSF